jgi:GlcNAc-P-P-Und epimerase
MGCAVIFGGAGFIGIFYAKTLIKKECYEKIYLLDFEAVESKGNKYRELFILNNPLIEQVFCDVRNEIDFNPPETVSLVCNFAAVHREPGHENFAYFQTNLLGAHNVCEWSEKKGCDHVLFTSSIAPYGSGEIEKDESTIPEPTTAYGSSKLVAEKIHQIWQARGEGRQLVIVRPGVVFGPSEGGNVSRLIKAVQKRYFFYTGNQNTRKAGIYVKELCNAMDWVFNSKKSKTDGVTLFNMSMNPAPSIEEYVDTIAKVSGVKAWFPTVPAGLLLFASYVVDFVAKIFGISHPFSPVRIKKLVRSNNISPSYLIEKGYPYLYSLDDAFIDWKKDCPEDWA